MRWRLLPLIALASFSACGGTDFDQSPLVVAASGDSGTSDETSANVSGPITKVDEVAGEYHYNDHRCQLEPGANSLSSTRLHDANNDRLQWHFLVTLREGSSTTTQINVTSLIDGVQRVERLTLSSSGTFSGISVAGKRCSIEYVLEGAVATCRYSDIPAVCTWEVVKESPSTAEATSQ